MTLLLVLLGAPPVTVPTPPVIGMTEADWWLTPREFHIFNYPDDDEAIMLLAFAAMMVKMKRAKKRPK